MSNDSRIQGCHEITSISRHYLTASALSPSDAFDSADDADHFLLFFLFLLMFFHSLLQSIFVHRGRLKGLALHPMSRIQSHVVHFFPY